MWDTFFKAPKLGCRGRGGGGRRGRSREGRGGAALHMSLQIGMASEFMKKSRKKARKKTAAANETRGGGVGFVRLRLFGREELPAHLSAGLPAAAHTHTHWRGPTRSRNINTSTRSCTQTKHVYEPSKGFFQEFHHYCYFCLFFVFSSFLQIFYFASLCEASPHRSGSTPLVRPHTPSTQCPAYQPGGRGF